MRYLLLLCFVLISGCTGIAAPISPVNNFNADRYLGRWYEIARLDHSFERGLSDVTATYSYRDDGGIRVVNRGYSSIHSKERSAEGKAYFVGDSDQAHLKVSFFGPFYGSYVVFELDSNNYQYAYVGSYNLDYLWLLSRTPVVTEQQKMDFIATAKAKGYDTDSLIWVEHKN